MTNTDLPATDPRVHRHDWEDGTRIQRGGRPYDGPYACRCGQSRWYTDGRPDSEPDQFCPPVGWFAFGTHIDRPGPLEFSVELDETGMPLWERPARLAPVGSEMATVASCRSAEEWEALNQAEPWPPRM